MDLCLPALAGQAGNPLVLCAVRLLAWFPNHRKTQ